MNVGLYFGSFNPIHIGHLIIANYVVQSAAIQQVWFVVSPQNPLKKSGDLLNEYHRLHLVTLGIENNSKFKICDVEFKLPKPSYTIDTLAYLKEKYPNHNFSIILGSDSLQNLHNWKNYQELINNYSFIVYKRPDFDVAAKDKNGAMRLQVVEAPLLEISATVIRKLLQRGKSIEYLVPEKVKIEIERNGYYK